MITLGLTGSIATGKSTLFQFFHRLGFQVFDCDAIVHKLYGHWRIRRFLRRHVPECIVSGAFERRIFRRRMLDSPELFHAFNALMHPLVLWRLRFFLWRSFFKNPFGIVIVDVPLLFENHYTAWFDYILVVWCDDSLQAERLRLRGVSEADARLFMEKQWSQSYKKAHAHFLIDTNHRLCYSLLQALVILRFLRHRL